MAEPVVPAVTGNAVLLLGYIAGALRLQPGADYDLVEIDAAGGTQVVRNRRTDNTFLISVIQVGGIE